MKSISILDCTLRDGGYINEWKFGNKTIKSIIDKLDLAKVDIVECGFLTEKIGTEDNSLFDDLNVIKKVLPNRKRNSIFVAMIAIGEKEIHPSKLRPYDGQSIDGIRLTFHPHEIDKAIEWARIIKDKGYKIFMQPVGTISYTDLELLYLVEKMNELNPYAFYIVDTLGSMYRNELFHTFYLIDKSLNPQIRIGFHAHNNLQLAFSNAQELSRIQTKRNLILDASVFGMGRAAGNLPTELITEYINRNVSAKYDVMMILDIYDEHISRIREKYIWGYEVPYHLSASNTCHPNYASFLINKQTLTMKDIEKIMMSIPMSNRAIFNKALVEQLYIEYQNKRIDDKSSIDKFITLFSGKDILVLAPGSSILHEYETLMSYIKDKEPYVISVNFVDAKYPIDGCFVSNHKRIQSIEEALEACNELQIIATSNVKVNAKNTIYVDYYSYINQDEMVFDNVGLMLLKLLKKCNVEQVTLAGFDGFKTRYNDNYYNEELEIKINYEELDEKQLRIKKQLAEISSDMKIKFLTKSIYEE